MTLAAIDLGATSGRVSTGTFDGRALTVREVHRFPNDAVWVGPRLHWDILRQLHEVKLGLRRAWVAADGEIASFAIDSWGLDFALLDQGGELICNPYHHRDPAHVRAVERTWQSITRRELFDRTGIQHMPVNGLFQLVSLATSDACVLGRAHRLLQIPDVLMYFLTGEQVSEYTNATTMQCVSLQLGHWDFDVLKRLGIPARLFSELQHAPKRTGSIRRAVREELGIGALPAIMVAQHDTASAAVAVPAEQPFAFLSSGTWSIMGTETSKPVTTDLAYEWNFSNEGGMFGTYRLSKNIMGLWILESCRRAWASKDLLSYEQMNDLVTQAAPFTALIDPDAPEFLNPTSMPRAVQEWCAAHGEARPESVGSVLRCVLESLALKYRLVLERLEALTATSYPGLHIVGGGSRNALLCQFTADAIGRPVWAGPAEATTIGNLLAQLMADGAIGSLTEARAVVQESFPIVAYYPTESDEWNDAYVRFRSRISPSEAV